MAGGRQPPMDLLCRLSSGDEGRLDHRAFPNRERLEAELNCLLEREGHSHIVAQCPRVVRHSLDLTGDTYGPLPLRGVRRLCFQIFLHSIDRRWCVQ
jgi:hypothetical protein